MNVYHQFKNEDGEPYGSFEVFHADREPPGWYWHACSPGCIPDGEPSGPFKTAQQAYDDAVGA